MNTLFRTHAPRGRRPWIGALLLLPLLVPFALLSLNCSSEDGPTRTSGNELNAIAGGGRGADDDPFNCGPGGSGPNPEIPGGPHFDPSTWIRPLLYLHDACGDAPARVVIEDSTAWRAWWEANTGCDDGMPMPGGMGDPDGGCARGHGDPHGHGGGFDGMPGDSGWVDPDSMPHGRLPFVDFTRDVVVAITIERLANDERMLAVEEVAGSESGTTVRYAVFHPAEDCGMMRPDSSGSRETAPAVAVLVPRPAAAPFTWVRRDTTFTCSWEPDPDRPLMLYYTDAPCDLGSSEQILTDQAGFDAWLDAALACDVARWGVIFDSTQAPGDSTWGPDGTPAGYSIPVDFDRFAVIVLRAGEQDRWGGGIWLTELRTSEAGTRIAYTVVEPGEACPPVADAGYDFGTAVDPTVAIRVPRPLPAPIRWERSVRTIDCNWGADGDSIMIGRDSAGVNAP